MMKAKSCGCFKMAKRSKRANAAELERVYAEDDVQYDIGDMSNLSNPIDSPT